MGKVLVTAQIENLEDLFQVRKGQLPPEKVRSVEVSNALVDTGATGFYLPKRLLEPLGLLPLRSRTARTLAGSLPLRTFGAVRLTVQERDCIVDVTEIGDEFSAIIGQVPLELLDWVVDPKGQRLIGNPEHGGEQMIDALAIRKG